MTQDERNRIIALVKREVVPAIGCTEPMAVALAVAKAKETLGSLPKQIVVWLSANMLKNAMGVGIPGTGMIGLPIAIALGALVGKSEYSLEVLKDTTPEDVEQGKEYIAQNRIKILQKKDTAEKLYIEVECHNGDDNVSVIITGAHTHFSRIAKNGEVLLDDSASSSGDGAAEDPKLTMRMVYDFAMTAPESEIHFILETAELNKRAAEMSLNNRFGHGLGRTIFMEPKCQFFGNGIYSKILSYTSAACDARMAGVKVPVMSNSGSGNQGIAATLPVWVFAKERLKTEEELARALMLSHLTVIYIKQSFGRLSPLCGCVVAATGSACGITWLLGGTYEQIVYAVKNMIANITGMICDGAKPSCSLKVATGVSTAVLSSMLAIEDEVVTPAEGIIDEDVEKCVRNMAAIGLQGMAATDNLVLDIMTNK
ncbi:MAG: serine dehydratase subunit alpha family protein [Bacteroidales bacterium]|nr:serine dehydratase subunit alpha family protein [Bacteroidales bacterium]MBR6175578.1 serine dehydratase subunit alpha family protein [Bacteroidales bacterium]MBR6905091.1 serine dehydratase subunit alpha family protein [Bacteroidales bacterium]